MEGTGWSPVSLLPAILVSIRHFLIRTFQIMCVTTRRKVRRGTYSGRHVVQTFSNGITVFSVASLRASGQSSDQTTRESFPWEINVVSRSIFICIYSTLSTLLDKSLAFSFPWCFYRPVWSTRMDRSAPACLITSN